MLLHPQVSLPAHCYHASAVQLTSHCGTHPEMAQEVSSRLQKPSRRSPSSSFYSASVSQLLLLSPPQPPVSQLHFWMLLCRRLHLVTSPRMCLRRRLINRTRFGVMWPSRRLSMVPLPYRWMLPAQTTSPSTLVSACLYADWFSLSFLVFC